MVLRLEPQRKMNGSCTTISRTSKGGSAGRIIPRKRGCESWAGTENMYSKVFRAANIRTGTAERIDERVSQSQRIPSRHGPHGRRSRAFEALARGNEQINPRVHEILGVRARGRQENRREAEYRG